MAKIRRGGAGRTIVAFTCGLLLLLQQELDSVYYFSSVSSRIMVMAFSIVPMTSENTETLQTKRVTNAFMFLL